MRPDHLSALLGLAVGGGYGGWGRGSGYSKPIASRTSRYAKPHYAGVAKSPVVTGRGYYRYSESQPITDNPVFAGNGGYYEYVLPRKRSKVSRRLRRQGVA